MVMVFLHYLEKVDSSNIKELIKKRNMMIDQNGKAQSSGTYIICIRRNEYSPGL